MARKSHVVLRRLVELVAQHLPQLEDPARAIVERRVTVDGLVVDNPASLVRSHAAIGLVAEPALRGEAKLAAALERFAVSVEGRVALDLGASAGGFTRVLLRAGARKVYAVDAGFGQLLGSLRLDPRVMNLERTNLGALAGALIPDEVDVVTADLSYVPLAVAIPQLEGRVRLARDADLIALVKPQFELRRSGPPAAADELRAAVDAATLGIESAGWTVLGATDSPVRGARGAMEGLVHAVRGKPG